MQDNELMAPVRRSAIKWAIALGIASILIASAAFYKVSTIDGGAQVVARVASPQSGLLARIEKSGELHAGYGVVPPYTQEDPNTKKVSGFNVDLIEAIARSVNAKVVWHRINWNTMSADLKRGEFDVIAEPILQTIPRAREFAFTEPFAFLPDGIGVVRKDDARFTNVTKFTDLDRADISIVVGQGWASEMFVRSQLSKPKIVPVQITTDLLQVFNEVVAGRADIAVVDGADAERFVNEHPDAVRALWLDNPPAAMPAAFALRMDDVDGARFLSVAMKYLAASGELDAMAKKHGIKTLPRTRQ